MCDRHLTKVPFRSDQGRSTISLARMLKDSKCAEPSSPPSSRTSEKESQSAQSPCVYLIREIKAIWADCRAVHQSCKQDWTCLITGGRIPKESMRRFTISHPFCKELLLAIVKVLSQASGWA